MLSVQPEIPGVSVNIYGDILQIGGMTHGQTLYTVTIAGEIQDIFGQKLGKDETLHLPGRLCRADAGRP